MRFKKGIAVFELMLMMALVFAFVAMMTGVNAATAISSASFCCEKTTSGAWCMNGPESSCNKNYLSSPTSCATTSYCRSGTCYESGQGICMENTPQRVCNNNGGTWDSRPVDQIPQCQLGCCIIGDQAAFVPLVRCKKLSTFFGVKNDYRTDITSEVNCIAKAQSQDVGACVYEKDFERTCEFTTRKDCGASEKVETINQSNDTALSTKKTFYKNVLCSNEELGTSCAKETSTTCYQGSVYWTDSCGNRENVYSDNKVKSWNNGRVQKPEAVCPPNDGSNINCGNCNYMLGSRCATYTGLFGGPKTGDKYCRKTECVDENGNKRMNGESWCIQNSESGNGKDLVGSRYFKESCVDGKVMVEPCADFRNEICAESSTQTGFGNFETAGCIVNRWQDCTAQTDKKDCLDIDKRDCKWFDSVLGMALGNRQQNSTGFSNPTASSNTEEFNNPTATGGVNGMAVITNVGRPAFGGVDSEQGGDVVVDNSKGVCAPNFPPGLEFWKKSSAKQICAQADAKCVVIYEKGLLGGKKIIQGAECLKRQWALNANKICTSLGDCGGSENYNGQYTGDGYKWVVDGVEKKFNRLV